MTELEIDILKAIFYIEKARKTMNGIYPSPRTIASFLMGKENSPLYGRCYYC